MSPGGDRPFIPRYVDRNESNDGKSRRCINKLNEDGMHSVVNKCVEDTNDGRVYD